VHFLCCVFLDRDELGSPPLGEVASCRAGGGALSTDVEQSTHGLRRGLRAAAAPRLSRFLGKDKAFEPDPPGWRVISMGLISRTCLLAGPKCFTALSARASDGGSTAGRRRRRSSRRPGKILEIGRASNYSGNVSEFCRDRAECPHRQSSLSAACLPTRPWLNLPQFRRPRRAGWMRRSPDTDPTRCVDGRPIPQHSSYSEV
jgi:hypothetical protein